MKPTSNVSPDLGSPESDLENTTTSSPGLDLQSTSRPRVARMLVGVMNTLRDTTNDPELPSQMIVLILTLATRSEPPGVLELAKIIGMSQASASRCVTVLGRGLRGKPGLGLVEAVEDPTNYSRKLVRLTAKGNRLVDALETTVLNAIRTLGVSHG